MKAKCGFEYLTNHNERQLAIWCQTKPQMMRSKVLKFGKKS
jgi:hypothetical protein